MNRNKLIIGFIGLAVLAVAIILSSRDVTRYNNTFTGESENWSAEMNSNGKEVFYKENGVTEYDSTAQSKFKIIYKGELSELSNLKRLEYHLGTPRGLGSSNMHFDRPPQKKTFTRSGSKLLMKDDVIEVTVTWDDKTEEFTLENKE